MADSACSKNFKILSGDDQCILLRAIGQLACADAETMTPLSKPMCLTCDTEAVGRPKMSFMRQELCDELILTMSNLIKISHVQRSPRNQIAAMIATRRILNHTGEAKQFDLTTVNLGKWCRESLESSSKELRIAAGFGFLQVEKKEKVLISCQTYFDMFHSRRD